MPHKKAIVPDGIVHNSVDELADHEILNHQKDHEEVLSKQRSRESQPGTRSVLPPPSASLTGTTKRRSFRHVCSSNLLATFVLWVSYFLCNAGYSTIGPFFPQEVKISVHACKAECNKLKICIRSRCIYIIAICVP